MMDWLTELIEETKQKQANLESNELVQTLKEINSSLQEISNNLRDIKFRINPIWK